MGMSIWAPPKLHVVWVPGADPIRDGIVADLAAATDVCLHEDPNRNGVMWNWASAVNCAAQDRAGSDWHFIVQDDQVPYRGWMQHLERACRNSPRPLLGLCWIGKSWDRGVRTGRPYMVGPNVLRGGSIAYHSSVLADDLPRFASEAAETTYKHDDMALCSWAQEWKGWNPALVSRTIFDSVKVKSLLGHSRYDTGVHSIESDAGPEWSVRPAFVEENQARHRDDKGWLLAEMGWTS